MSDERSFGQHGICSNCAEDVYLKQLIIDGGETGYCSECQVEESRVFTSKRLAEHFVDVMRYRLTWGDEWGDRGDNLQYYVWEFLRQYFAPQFVDEIVQEIVSTQTNDEIFSGDAFWDSSRGYKRQRINHEEYEGHWRAAHESLQHESRFFSDRAKALFDELFCDIERLNIFPSPYFVSYGQQSYGTIRKSSVVTMLPTGHILWRGRTCNTDENFEEWKKLPLKHVGPPPSKFSRAGRMNAEGVVVLYCADDSDTCLAELRPSLSSMHAVIQLRTTKPLRLLDFRKLPKAKDAYAVSDFHPRYEFEISRRAFLKQIHRLISQPIAPGHESEYLITQAMSEYLAHVCKPRFDGIIFGSAQRERGTNYVIFGRDETMKAWGEPHDFPIEYIDDSLEFFKTSTVEYTHQKQHYLDCFGTGILVGEDYEHDSYDEDREHES